MGDRAQNRPGAEKDPELSKRLDKMRKQQQQRDDNVVGIKSLADVVDTADQLQLSAGGVGYIPKNKISQKAYEGLLAFVVGKVGDQPYEYLRDAAEETLTILKSEKTSGVKTKEVADTLDAEISEDDFSKLSTFARTIDDFGNNNTAGGAEFKLDDGDDDDTGVAVIFGEDGEDDDDSDSAPDEVKELNDEDGNPIDSSAPILRGNTGDSSDDDEDDDIGPVALPPTLPSADTIAIATAKKAEFDPLDVDGFWIQRKIKPLYPDAHECQAKAEKVLEILSEPTHNASCENKLMYEFDFEYIEFIKLAVKYRTPIMFCTRLQRAQTEEEKKSVENEMRETEEGLELLAALKINTSDGNGVQENGVNDAGGDTKTRKRRRRAEKHANGNATVEEDAIMQENTGSTEPMADIPPVNNVAMDIESGKGKKKSKEKLRKIDLDDLVFTQGNHLLSTKNVSFNAEHLQYKDYEEWHIPAVEAPIKAGERAPFPVASLPAWARPAFQKTTHLNRLQTAVEPSAFESDENLLICAPTGAGKTNVALLTVLRALYNSKKNDVSMDEFTLADANLDAFKVVYVAPMKALVSEVVTKMGSSLKEFGISVRELTGDMNLSRRQIEDTQVIVTTPEKWDVITRKSGERTFTSLVRLLIIDEIHLLHDDRGPVLEAIIARTMRNLENVSVVTRVVGLSATLPNYKDVGALLQVNEEKGLFYFDSSYRPSPLQQCYVGVTARKAVKRFKIMNDIMFEKVKSQVMGSNQVIVFVHSRKETASAARLIVDRSIEDESIGYFMQHDSPSYNTIQAELDDVDDSKLKNLLIRGIGTHHAGMSRKDRLLVEGLFEAKHIKVLVSTATLAWGVNLPAHAVIIKGTQVYSPENGRWIELSPLDVMQMMGRAGRPQFDKYGEGFIITTSSEVQFYLSLLNQQLPIESHFVSRLVDLLNAEIATGCVTNLNQGAKWLTYTYLFIRMVRNPVLYHVPVDERQEDPTLEKRRKELIHSAATVLHKSKLIKYNKKTGEMTPTELGRIASDFYVCYKTMAIYKENMHESMNDLDLFRLFSLSSEFKHMRIREEEKIEVQKLSEIVPIPIKDSPAGDPTAKVNVLLQTYIASLPLDGLVLKSDMIYITQNAARLTRALLQIFIDKGWANVVEICLSLCKMVEKRQWIVQTPLRQFRGTALKHDAIRKIERKYMEFDKYLNMSSSDMGELLRDQRLGKSVHKLVHSLPRMDLEVNVRPLTRSTLEFEVILTPDFIFKSNLHGAGESFWIFVEDADSKQLLYSENFYLRKSVAKSRQKSTLVFNVKVTMPRPPHYFVKCFSDRWIGSETEFPVPFRNLILPDKFPAHTDYLNLRPLPVDAALTLAENDTPVDQQAADESLAHIKAYFKKALGSPDLSPLLNQLVPTVFKDNGNSIIASLPGQDRDLAICLAIGRLFALNPASTVVWIVGLNEEVELVKTFLSSGIAGILKLDVGTLKGEHAIDVATLGKGASIVVSIPQHFDALSRKWQGKKENKALSNIGLVILDGIHLLNEDEDAGVILEVVGSRLRYLSQQLSAEGDAGCRIVGISDPIANAKDVGEWLGCSKDSIHSFLPSSLPECPVVKVWPCVSRFGGGTLTSPAALSRQILDAIKQFASKGSESIVLFVPTRKTARAMAMELVTIAPGQGMENGYLQESRNTIEPYLNTIKLKSLRECLSYGIVYLHEGLTEADRNVAEMLFKKGIARVLVTTAKFARSSDDVKGRLVIVAGTATEEAGGYSVQRAEYSKSDITRMMCCAVPSSRGTPGTCVVMTERSLKEYYETICLKPTPLESQLTQVLADQINAEVASGVIDTKESVLAYLTWTFFFRRLPKNPNYYNLGGTSHMEKSSHLSSLVDQSLADLKDSKCVQVDDDDMTLSALNLGTIAAYYYITHATVERFAASITPKMRMKKLLGILSHASEFEDIPARIGDEDAIERLSENMPVKIKGTADGENASLFAPHVKVHLLLQSYMSRLSLAGDLNEDRNIIVERSVRLLRALVDIVSSAGWLEPTLICMELSQMLVQAVWGSEKPLAQLPHFDENLVNTLEQLGVEGVTDLYDMDPAERKKALGSLSKTQVNDVAEALQRYPDVEWEVEEPVWQGDDDNTVLVVVRLERESDEDDEDEEVVDEVPTVYAQHFPQKRSEGWWVVIGETSTNTLYSVRHVALKKKKTVKCRFSGPEKAGKHELIAYLISDCYLDCDQQENFTLDVPVTSNEEEDGRMDGIELGGETTAMEV